jgi:hypothetical protein
VPDAAPKAALQARRNDYLVNKHLGGHDDLEESDSLKEL